MRSPKAWFLDRAQKAIVLHMRAARQQVVPTPVQQGVFNFRCHDNCTEYVRMHPELSLRIMEVMMVEDNIPTLHYVVYNPDLCQYGEVTLGWRTSKIEYYIIRELPTYLNEHIHEEFERSLRYWLNEYTPAWARWLFNMDRVC